MARQTKTGGRDATTAIIPGSFALSIGRPDLPEPTGFTWTDLSRLARLESGHTPSRSNPEYWDGGIPWIGIRDATANHGLEIQDTNQHVTQAGIDNSSARLLPAGTVCLSRTASVGYVVTMGIPMATSQDFVNWVCGPEISAKYLKYILQLEQDSIRRFAYGTTHQTLYYPDAKAFHVLLPELPEQKSITEVLGALDDKIAANNKIARTIEALGSAKFMRAGLDVEPSSEQVLLGDIFDLNPRRTVTSASPTVIDMQALPTAAPLVERWSTGIRKGGTRFANGDSLIARITPCLENRKTAFVDFLKDGDVGIGSTEFIVMRSKNGLPLGLSYFMATSDRFRDFAIQNMVGTSGRQRVTASDLARHTLCPVDPSELRTFGEWADANLKVLGSLRGENRTLATTRDALLPQLMSGKLSVREAEDAVTAVI